MTRNPKNLYPPPIIAPLDKDGMQGLHAMLKQMLGSERVTELLTCEDGSVVVTDPALLDKTQGKPGPEEKKRFDDDLRKAWTRYFDAAHKRHKQFVDFRAAPAGYAAQILLCRSNASNAYRAVVETIYRLGRYTIDFRQDKRSYRRSIAACGSILASLTRCDCWTAYTWHDGHVLPSLAHSEGLWYREALNGIAATIPTRFVRRMLNDAEVIQELYEGYLDETYADFRVREQIDKCWSVRLKCGRVQAIVYLNWRKDKATGPKMLALPENQPPSWMEDRLRDMQSPMHKSPAIASSLNALRPCVNQFRSLKLSVQQMNGWLQEEAPRYAKRSNITDDIPIEDLQYAIIQAFDSLLMGEEKPRGDNGWLTLSRNIRLRLIAKNLMREVDDATTKIYAVSGKENTIHYGDEVLYDLQGGEIECRDIQYTQSGQGLVQEKAGISAQAIIWRTSILMQDVLSTKPGVKADELSLHRRILTRDKPPKNYSELAIPIYNENRPAAVISVESPNPKGLSVDIVRKLEVFSLIVGSLGALCSIKPSKQVHGALVHAFGDVSRVPWDEASLWASLSHWARDLVEADLVHIAVAGSSRHIKRYGVSASNTLLDTLCDRVRNETKRASSKSDGSANSEALLLLSHEQQEVREQGVASIIRGQDGRTTWGILNNNKRTDLWQKSEKNRSPTWLSESLGSSLGIGLASNPNMSPTACLWLGWINPAIAKKISKTRKDQIAKVGAVYASLHLAYRLHELIDTP